MFSFLYRLNCLYSIIPLVWGLENESANAHHARTCFVVLLKPNWTQDFDENNYSFVILMSATIHNTTTTDSRGLGILFTCFHNRKLHTQDYATDAQELCPLLSRTFLSSIDSTFVC